MDKARPGLDLYAQAPAGAAQGEVVVCRDVQPSLQARQRGSATQAAAPGGPIPVAERAKRLGAVPLGCALRVAAGLTGARTRSGTTCADFQAFLLAWLQSALGGGLQVVHRRLEKGSTHAPHQLGSWMASLTWSFAGRMDWLPTPARGLDPVEIICSKVPRDVLTPHDFPSTRALEKPLQHYGDARKGHPKPMPWT